jgi:predicted nucleotidyltransferase
MTVAETIAAALGTRREIRLAMLFGSHVTGRTTAEFVQSVRNFA